MEAAKRKASSQLKCSYRCCVERVRRYFFYRVTDWKAREGGWSSKAAWSSSNRTLASCREWNPMNDKTNSRGKNVLKKKHKNSFLCQYTAHDFTHSKRMTVHETLKKIHIFSVHLWRRFYDALTKLVCWHSSSNYSPPAFPLLGPRGPNEGFPPAHFLFSTWLDPSAQLFKCALHELGRDVYDERGIDWLNSIATHSVRDD